MTNFSYQRDFAVDVVRKLREAGHIALFAGGCVRDFMLGRPSKDFDVATTALPEQVRSLFGHRRTLAVGANFGVIVVIGPREAGHVEVATFRTEGSYVDGRRPENVAFCGPEEDARRRDFTINGMFYDPIDDQVFDYVDGQTDLKLRIIRAIGDPHERVREDKLRMLRAIRFTATLNFDLDPATAAAIREMSSELVIVSAERIAQELKKMLVDPNRRRSIELAQDTQLLRIILPELDSLECSPEWVDLLKTLELLREPSFELAFATLLKMCPTSLETHNICRRLKLSNEEIDRIGWLVSHQNDLDDAPSLDLAALKRRLAHRYCPDLLRMSAADRTARSLSLESIHFCHDYLARTSMDEIDPPPVVTGDDLIELGLRPGPNFKSALEKIRDAQLNCELTSREQALSRVKELFSS